MHYVSNHDCYLGIIVYLHAQHNTIDISLSSLIVKMFVTDATRSTHILKTRLFINIILACLVLFFFSSSFSKRFDINITLAIFIKNSKQSIAYTNTEKSEILNVYHYSISCLHDNEARLPEFNSACNM